MVESRASRILQKLNINVCKNDYESLEKCRQEARNVLHADELGVVPLGDEIEEPPAKKQCVYKTGKLISNQL